MGFIWKWWYRPNKMYTRVEMNEARVFCFVLFLVLTWCLKWKQFYGQTNINWVYCNALAYMHIIYVCCNRKLHHDIVLHYHNKYWRNVRLLLLLLQHRLKRAKMKNILPQNILLLFVLLCSVLFCFVPFHSIFNMVR